MHSPYDGSVIGEVPACTAADVDRAVAAAKAALAAGPLPLWKRAEILDAAAARLTARREEFARIIAGEAAKPIKTARVEAERAVGHVPVRRRRGPQAVGRDDPARRDPAGEGKLGFTLRVPIGVVGAIAPFNFPLNLVVHKVAPAIAAGCPVVLKPAQPDTVQLDRAGRDADRRVRAAGRPAAASSRVAVARSATRSSTIPTSR